MMLSRCFSVVVVVVDVIIVIMKRMFTLYDASCHDAGTACLDLVLDGS